MYEAFFGFSQQPFAAAPLANCYFPAGSIDAARQTLARSIERSEGAGLLIGPPGTGKTLLLQVLATQFTDSFSVVPLTAGLLETRRELLQAILFELKLQYRGLEEGELRLALVDHLTRGEKAPRGLLLLVDEAHTLPVLLLEELRIMTNLARDGEVRVRLVLSGNLDLEELFAGPQLQAFSQRLSARCYLEAFDRHETSDYIRFQVAVAGGQAERVFDAAAMDAVHRATEGIPRLVNQLCDHALLLAYSQERRPVDAATIDEAWANLQQLPGPWQGALAPRADRSPPDVVEFGPLTDESAESIELDFTAALAAARPLQNAARGNHLAASVLLGELVPPRGLQVVEHEDNLQVVVDPYASLDEADDPDEECEQRTSCHDERVTMRSAPVIGGRGRVPAAKTAPTSGASAMGEPRHELMEEELVSDHYAQLDARQPRSMGASPSLEPAASNARPERITLAEAMRRRIQAETAAAVARSVIESQSPLPHTAAAHGTATPATASKEDLGFSGESREAAFEERLTRHLTEVLDAGQLEELRRELAAATQQQAAADSVHQLASDLTRDDILVIDKDGDAQASSPPAHRVERQDYKSLFAKLRQE